MIATAIVALGANLGERHQTLAAACQAIRQADGIRRVVCSSVIETEPVGGPAQPRYLNAVAQVDTTLSPRELLALCLRIESEHGRERTVRWGPRTLDLDLITYRVPGSTDLATQTPELTLPHPRAAERDFVLRPWLELEPDATLAVAGANRRVADLLAQALS